MNKNLRSKKGVEAAQESTSMENNLERLTTLVSNLGEKLDKLDTDSRSRHDEICGKLQLLEERTNTLGKEVNDMKEGLNFVDEEVKTVKDSLMKKADQTHVAELAKKIEDLENRSKRNNIVIWNVPEGAERDSTCVVNHMGLGGNFEVMRAHRTSIRNRQNTSGGAERPIHVYLLRYTDKQHILRNAASKLRDKPYQEAHSYTFLMMYQSL